MTIPPQKECAKGIGTTARLQGNRGLQARYQPRWHALCDVVFLYTVVALGTVIGGVLRALVSFVTVEILEESFPWGTLTVNLIGSFVIALYATLTAPDGCVLASRSQREFVMTGICGGFTTFSVFSLETLYLVQKGQSPLAGLNIGISVVAWITAAWLGHDLASRMNRWSVK